MVHAIQRIVAGETYFSFELFAIFQQSVQQECNVRKSSFFLLTALERQVLELISDEKYITQIGACLNISDKHVETLRRHIMPKLKIYSTAELTKFATR